MQLFISSFLFYFFTKFSRIPLPKAILRINQRTIKIFAINMNSEFEIDDVIDLTNIESHTNRVLSNSIICIDSDDSLIYSPANERVLRKSTHEKKYRNENFQTRADKSEKPSSQKDNKIRIGECPICCEELGTKPLASTMCGHVYCIECLKKSLETVKRCPMCRTILKGKLAYHPLYLGR